MRILLAPKVWMPRDPEMVEYRTPVGSPNEYFETVLTPEEAENHALELLIDARRAKQARACRQWLEKPSEP